MCSRCLKNVIGFLHIDLLLLNCNGLKWLGDLPYVDSYYEVRTLFIYCALLMWFLISGMTTINMAFGPREFNVVPHPNL